MDKVPFPVLILDPGSRPDGTPDLPALFAIAKAYADTARIAGRVGEQHKQFAMAFPAFICSSFALELFLKLFVYRSRAAQGPGGKPVWGHLIRELWQEVTSVDKETIAGFFRNESGEPWLTSASIRIEIFENALEDLGAKPFVEWRYIHEMEDGPTVLRHGPLVEVLDAVGRAAAYVLKRDGQHPGGAGSENDGAAT